MTEDGNAAISIGSSASQSAEDGVMSIKLTLNTERLKGAFMQMTDIQVTIENGEDAKYKSAIHELVRFLEGCGDFHRLSATGCGDIPFAK